MIGDFNAVLGSYEKISPPPLRISREEFKKLSKILISFLWRLHVLSLLGLGGMWPQLKFSNKILSIAII